jgi:hypothetical protein
MSLRPLEFDRRRISSEAKIRIRLAVALDTEHSTQGARPGEQSQRRARTDTGDDWLPPLDAQARVSKGEFTFEVCPDDESISRPIERLLIGETFGRLTRTTAATARSRFHR